jgi:hypothetical protein
MIHTRRDNAFYSRRLLLAKLNVGLYLKAKSESKERSLEYHLYQSSHHSRGILRFNKPIGLVSR